MAYLSWRREAFSICKAGENPGWFKTGACAGAVAGASGMESTALFSAGAAAGICTVISSRNLTSDLLIVALLCLTFWARADWYPAKPSNKANGTISFFIIG